VQGALRAKARVLDGPVSVAGEAPARVDEPEAGRRQAHADARKVHQRPHEEGVVGADYDSGACGAGQRRMRRKQRSVRGVCPICIEQGNTVLCILLMQSHVSRELAEGRGDIGMTFAFSDEYLQRAVADFQVDYGVRACKSKAHESRIKRCSGGVMI
jgi:hypothetical protein